MVRAFDTVSNEYDSLPFQGDRVLDKLTDNVIDGFDDADYHLVVRGQEFPYLETNTPDIDGPRPGIDAKGELPLALVNAEEQVIEAYMSSIPRFEGEREEQLERFADSVEYFNEETGSDWSVRGVLYREDAVWNVDEHDYDAGVYTTPEDMDVLRQSGPFAVLSSDFFGGWLEISPRTMLERR